MREIVLGNGTMMVNFDRELNLRDLYWPYGGFENHGDGNRTSFGIYADYRFSWISASEWDKKLGYLEDTPITSIEAHSRNLGLRLTVSDALHSAEDVLIKKIIIKNLRAETRNVKVIFYQDFSIRGIEAGDSALFDPRTGGVCQYKKGVYILCNCGAEPEGKKEFCAGVKRYRGREGTFRDAEDGHLSNNPVADGPVDSAIGIEVSLPAEGERVVYYWIITGHRMDDLRRLNCQVESCGPERLVQQIRSHHQAWIKRAGTFFADLPEDVVRLFKHSLFVIKSQVNRRGAVVASPDADTFLVARDHYMYLWPRDAALVANALDAAGYPEEARRIYSFCASVMSGEGYFLQRYNPDGTPGCTWHPMFLDGREIPPIQEDETALVIWALGRHYFLHGDIELIQELYPRLIKPALAFMCGYIDRNTGLMLPSWDLWEERRGVFSWTLGAVCGALKVGADMAEALGDKEIAARCRSVSRVLKASAGKIMFDPSAGRFLRGLTADRGGRLTPDYTLDASLYGLSAFGAFAPGDDKIVKTMQAVGSGLWVNTDLGGVARYTDDYYHQVSRDIGMIPGNPWIVTTLWLADWHIARNLSPDDLERARRLLSWTARRAGSGLLLPEQADPYTGHPLSVCPLTWSHSALVKTVVDYVNGQQPKKGM